MVNRLHRTKADHASWRGSRHDDAADNRPVCSTGSGGGEGLEDLLVQVASGSRTAFAGLYECTCTVLFALARLGGDTAAAAEERVSVAYAWIWRNAPQYHPEDSALAWILHQARRSGE